MTISGAARAHAAVYAAIKNGEIPPITNETVCVDCGKPAKCYDHRDYNKPLDVVAVCHYCNNHRGEATPYANCHKTKKPKERTNIYLPEQNIDKLKKLADETGLSVAELVRRAIDDFLKRQK